MHIRSIRLASGLTQSDLAKEVNSTKTNISKAEMGHKSVKILADRIYDFYGTNTEERLSHYENNEHPQTEDFGQAVSEGQ